MDSSVTTNLFNPSTLSSLVISSSSEDLLRFANTLLESLGRHDLQQSRHTADVDIVRLTILRTFENIDELLHECIRRFNHEAKFEDLRLNGLFLDQRRSKCLPLDGIIECILGTNASESQRCAGESKSLRVEVCWFISNPFELCFCVKSHTRHDEGETLVLLSKKICDGHAYIVKLDEG